MRPPACVPDVQIGCSGLRNRARARVLTDRESEADRGHGDESAVSIPDSRSRVVFARCARYHWETCRPVDLCGVTGYLFQACSALSTHRELPLGNGCEPQVCDITSEWIFRDEPAWGKLARLHQFRDVIDGGSCCCRWSPARPKLSNEENGLSDAGDAAVNRSLQSLIRVVRCNWRDLRRGLDR